MDSIEKELEEIKTRYSRRINFPEDMYDPLNPAMNKISQEKERALIKWIQHESLSPVSNLKLLEIGCGNGQNLIQFLKFGFNPDFLVGNELLPERVRAAKKILPLNLKIVEGNALDLNFSPESFDIVFQSMVFSSILEDSFQLKLAKKMWELTKIGGGVLWYDFTFNNPKNQDVQGVKLKRVKELFPQGKIQKWRITLAPPLSRIVTSIHPLFYNAFNIFPFLRTHILCWIKKT